MTLYPFAQVQPTQCTPKRIRPLGRGAAPLTLALALGAAACGLGTGNGIAVDAGVTDATDMGLTLTLTPGVRGITPQDVTLTPPLAIARARAADTSNTRYTLATDGWLARGREYTLTIAKAGYRIQAVRFTRSGTPSSAAAITKMTLTAYGLAVEGTIQGTHIRFPHGARSADGRPTLTGTVSLALSEGAVLDGESPHDTEKSFSSTPTNITVRAEDGSTTQTYAVATEAYNKATNPYGVYTPAQLHGVRDGLTAGYRLMQDVTLPGVGSDCTKPDWAPNDYCTAGFSPIGPSTTSPFSGTFDGNKHRIRNLFIQRSTVDSVGLFGCVGTSGEIRALGVHIAASGAVRGRDAVGGLAGRMQRGGTVSNCYAVGVVSGRRGVGGLVGHGAGAISNAYAAGAVSGRRGVGGLVGRMQRGGTVSNAYAVGVVSGRRGVGGLVGRMQRGGTVSNTYAVGAVSGRRGVGGLVGRMQRGGSITKCYYPFGRPAGAGGTALGAGGKRTDFSGFSFPGGAATPGWKWVAGQWPQLNGFEAAQATPSLTAHRARVSVRPVPDSTGFTIALTPPLSGLTKDDWALYNSATGAAVRLARVSAAGAGAGAGTSYAFEASLAMGASYRLLYTKPDVIVLPQAAGHRVIGLPSSTDVVQMTLTVHGVVVPGKITPGAANKAGSIVFSNAPRGANASLTGLVSLVLAKGARVAGTTPHGEEKTYTTAPQTLQLQVQGGTATKTYKISVAAYDASKNPYGVYTPAQLHGVRDGLQASYRLMQDVTLPGAGSSDCTRPAWAQGDYCTNGFKPIGTSNTPFTGTFDGNAHAIRKLVIRSLYIGSSASDNVGLFGSMGASGKIRDLGVTLAPAGVTGGDAVGGLVGYSTGSVSNCYVDGAVFGASKVGGLVGESAGSITNCYATGAVTGNGTKVGGLVGESAGAISNTYATGAVSGGWQVGGLVGAAGGAIANAYATGAVSGSDDYVGGLVGESAGTISNTYATGVVSGKRDVGGLVGAAGGAITNAYATGTVTGNGTRVGGLVGESAGSITNCYATGAVTGNGSTVGGLVGAAGGAITNCYATGAVSGGNTVGGLVGMLKGGRMRRCYATGTVLGGDYVGGLVGYMPSGGIANAYATGAVLGASYVGGLAGYMPSGSIANAYATGTVLGGDYVGGLVGYYAAHSASVVYSYYPLGRPRGEGTAGTALSSGALRKAVFTGFAFAQGAAAWKWGDGAWPKLTGFKAPQTTPGLTFHKATLSLTPVPGTAGFTLALTPPLSGLTKEDWALYDGSRSAVPLTRVSAAHDGARYAFKATLLMGTSYRLLYTRPDVIVLQETAGRMAIRVPSSTDVVRMTLTTADGAVVPGTITPGAADAGSTIVFSNAPKGSDASLTGVVSLVLAKGAQVEGVSLQGTMETYGSTPKALTVWAEDGMTATTYTISVAAYHKATNPYGVYTEAQLYALREGLSGGYRLMQDVTLPGAGSGCTQPAWAQTDYCTAGWKPIGTSNSPFLGTFDGNGHRINNLFIGRSTTDAVGLFGFVGASSAIRDLGVHIAPTGVTGRSRVGGLVGDSSGSITSCYATGAVSGGSSVGGLAGHNSGIVSNAYAAGAVSGGGTVGGLVGHSSGIVSNAYATAAVSGGSTVGGLLGSSAGGIAASYAAGAVLGGSTVGGLVGSSAGSITTSYAAGAVLGGSTVGGLVGSSAGSITTSYAAGAVTGSNQNIGGLVGEVRMGGSVTNCYATGATVGQRSVGGLIGWLAPKGRLATSYAIGAVTARNAVGGLVGYKDGTVSSGYYPLGRPAGRPTSGTPVNVAAEKLAFDGFVFSGTRAAWKWVKGQWPRLKVMKAPQTTPSLAFYMATVTAPTTDGFTMTLTPPLSGLTKDDWALYEVTSTACTAVPLTAVTEASNGRRYTFTAASLVAGTHHLAYTKADIIVVPSPAGHITVTVPGN